MNSSLIWIAKHHGLDSHRYYVKFHESTPHCQTVEDYETLLPWNIEMEKVGANAVAV